MVWVNIRFSDNALEINDSLKKKGKVSNINYIATTPCHFGGGRQWLVCLGCHNNALVLYVVNRFRCRKYHGLYYLSSNEGEFYRPTIAMCNYQDKLNGKELRLIDGISGLSKPKCMKYRTYFKLHNEAYLREKKLFNEYRRAFGIFGDY
jgi:hypothetical protein